MEQELTVKSFFNQSCEPQVGMFRQIQEWLDANPRIRVARMLGSIKGGKAQACVWYYELKLLAA